MTTWLIYAALVAAIWIGLDLLVVFTMACFGRSRETELHDDPEFVEFMQRRRAQLDDEQREHEAALAWLEDLGQEVVAHGHPATAAPGDGNRHDDEGRRGVS